jgi:hypothetical protein
MGVVAAWFSGCVLVDFLLDAVAGFQAAGVEVVVHLQAEPEFGGVAEVVGETQGGVGGDAPFAQDDFRNRSCVPDVNGV